MIDAKERIAVSAGSQDAGASGGNRPAERGRTVLRQETGQREIFPADCLGIVLDILRIVW